MLIKVFINLIFIISPSYSDTKVFNFTHETPKIHSKLKELLKSCFRSRLNTLVITSELNEVAREMLNESTLINVYLINEDFDIHQKNQNFPQWPIFLLAADSQSKLTNLLQRLKSSTYWNSDSTFFIVGKPGGGCDNQLDLLFQSWKMNLLAVFSICEDKNSEVALYTYNPFTSRAPISWKKVETQSKVDRWTLYRRLLLDNNQLTCQNMEFDKTKYLDGYKVNIVATLKSGESWNENNNYTTEDLIEKQELWHASISKNVWSRMNVTPIIIFDPKVFEGDGKYEKLTLKFKNNIYDFAMRSLMLEIFENVTFDYTYPYLMYDISILTKHREFLSPAEKLANFYGLDIIFLSILVYLITWIILTVQNNGKMALAALEILRMVVSTSLLKPLQQISLRIYIFGVLWLILILNATFQGNMSQFLTKPTRVDIRSVEDLKTDHYRIYIQQLYRSSMHQHLQNIPKNYLHYIDDLSCCKYIINDSKAACIQHRTGMFHAAKTYNLHISHKSIIRVFFSYAYRDDWPLQRKMHSCLSWLMNSGILHYWRSIVGRYRMLKLEAMEQEATKPQIRAIRLADLSFAFVIFGMGLMWATLFFIIEVGGNPTKKRRSKPKNQKHLSLRKRNARMSIEHLK